MLHRRTLSNSFRRKLRRGKYTKWAADLTESEVYQVLWMVGEFGCRAQAEYGGEELLQEFVHVGRRDAALSGLAQFARGKPCTFEEALEAWQRENRSSSG